MKNYICFPCNRWELEHPTTLEDAKKKFYEILPHAKRGLREFPYIVDIRTNEVIDVNY